MSGVGVLVRQVEKIRRELVELEQVARTLQLSPTDESSGRLFLTMARRLTIMAQNLEQLGKEEILEGRPAGEQSLATETAFMADLVAGKHGGRAATR